MYTARNYSETLLFDWIICHELVSHCFLRGLCIIVADITQINDNGIIVKKKYLDLFVIVKQSELVLTRASAHDFCGNHDF